jgi:predicted RNA methylase
VDEYWSSSDFAYLCLLDHARTRALRDAIHITVRPGDTVLDVGAGTGVLSLFAAEAGARSVLSAEVDPSLAQWIRETAEANGYGDRIEVLAGDVLDHDVPRCDVVIAELVETALIEETLVPVLNALDQRGVIGTGTRVIPCGYRTRVQLVHLDERLYGFRFNTFRHQWPFYGKSSEWEPVSIEDRSAPVEIWSSELGVGPVDDVVDIGLTIQAHGDVNGLRIMGEAALTGTLWLGACNTFNGDKIYPLPHRRAAGPVGLAIRYRMGAGLRHLDIHWT